MRMLYHFDWDSAKAAVNLRKHDIALGDARFFILDEHRIDRLDERYDYGEDRRVSIAAVDGEAHARHLHHQRKHDSLDLRKKGRQT